MGQLYYKGLANHKNYLKNARRHYTDCVRLGSSLLPKDLSAVAWYKSAFEAREEIIEKMAREEDAENNKDSKKSEIIKELEPELASLRSAKGIGHKSFMILLLTDTFWPKDRTKIVIDDKELKNTFRKFFVPFHPD